ncbi:hypothetical protein Moror_7804 [Moniliophthora roreri MCA 2997]|uniref:Uncharacterized protein n=2 Tax=Moniliophthora roreri TaxID=221103 RepID=V2YEN7_MONRO|nr:hypothetical protein Moror_7804 [Moniliophthora roreri MCA 2997]KAI3616210.1 hypothetical protein WG66_014139 [Moniliophthora roreri]KAI3616211.1 hypothetical protein WG66_014139 [Moniliophthora roreri]KAI3616212.1 hypothetical protein WG66_014139 [Moniliophthora roreri]KAI3616213.1 hypothetical protein WG66_014139 [Moniliophthora roreri]
MTNLYHLNSSNSSDELISPIKMTFSSTAETLAETFNPYRDLLELPRSASPTSIRATYIPSRPTSYADLEGETPLNFAGFSDLAYVDASLERDIRRIRAAHDKLEDIQTTRAPSSSYTETNLSRYESTNSRRSAGTRRGNRHYMENDRVSIITTRTTISTCRAVRNLDAAPPVLRRREVGRKYSVSGGVKDEEQKRAKESWKAPSRIKERFSLKHLFSNRKENAGILDRDATSARRPNKSFGFMRSTKVTKVDTTQEIRVGTRKTSIFGRSTRNASSSSKNALDATNIPPVPAPTPLSAEQLRNQRVRRSRSFAGFRDSTIDTPPSPIVFRKFFEDCDNDEFDEITREATRVNEGVRRNFSYEESD